MPIDPLSMPVQPAPTPPKPKTGARVITLLAILTFAAGGFAGGFIYAKDKYEQDLAALEDKTKKELADLRDELGAIQLVKIRVYFTKGGSIQPMERRVIQKKNDELMNLIVEELLAGPVDEEKPLGISTAIPEGTELVSLTIEGGTATVTFSAKLKDVPKAMAKLVREQIEKTLKEPNTVDEVVIKIDGVAEEF